MLQRTYSSTPPNNCNNGIVNEPGTTPVLSYKQVERHIYGSTRIGLDVAEREMIGAGAPGSTQFERVLGYKQFEMSEHRGNVMAVVLDSKVPRDDNQDLTVDYYQPLVISATDYSPFLVRLYGRSFNSSAYRYSGQGQEHDDEVKGEGNSLNFTYRMHDSRLGRFFILDPLSAKYPHYSPYSFSGNKVIQYVELEGLEESISEIQATNRGLGHYDYGYKPSEGALIQAARHVYNFGAVFSAGVGNAATVYIPQTFGFEGGKGYDPVLWQKPSEGGWTFSAESNPKIIRETTYQAAGFITTNALSAGGGQLIGAGVTALTSKLAFQRTGLFGLSKPSGSVLGLEMKPTQLGSSLTESTLSGSGLAAKGGGPIVGGGAKLEYLGNNVDRIQSIATKYNLEITVVGGRAKGTANALSDWDYIITGGTSKTRSSALFQLPRNLNAVKDGMSRPGSEILKGVTVDPNLPHIIFKPTN